jgi:hypothetical protein
MHFAVSITEHKKYPGIEQRGKRLNGVYGYSVIWKIPLGLSILSG